MKQNPGFHPQVSPFGSMNNSTINSYPEINNKKGIKPRLFTAFLLPFCYLLFYFF